MPIGSWSAFTRVVQGLCATNPTSVLDLGIGYGMNGAAVRNWLDLGVHNNIKLEGVEAWAKYKSPLWGCYDKVHNITIEKFFETDSRKFDLIIMTDVIEHFPKDEGIRLLRLMKERCNKAVMVSTPGVWIEQGEYMGNKYEEHKSMWDAYDFVREGYGLIMDGKLDQFGHMMILADYIKK
jgi:hypothetical protein